jgi:CHAD domain-containing protein
VAFRLKKNEAASAGIRRIVSEEIDEAIKLVEDEKTDPAETIHELRKHFKRMRAVVRLVRDELGDEIYRRENGVLRDLGRRLSPARDAAVRVSALDRLQEKDGVSKADVAALRNKLVLQHRAAVRRVHTPTSLDAIRRELSGLRRRVRSWPLTKPGFGCLEFGLRRSYRDGKRNEVDAYTEQTDEAFHEWRKRAKDLRYHVELFKPTWPEVMMDVEDALHDLTDRLGDDHDLADLRRVLTTTSNDATTVVQHMDRVLDRIAHRQSELHADARPLAARIYAEKPRSFSERLAAYWDAWRA